MADLEQKRRSVRVLELLDESFQAHQRGDSEAFRRALDAALECDADVVAVVQGGMIIGEIPRPEEHPNEWQEYLQANRGGLAEMEQEAADG
jgi:sugar phosphate isomerase/epimerase